jgi:6-phosphogluconolactonase/glucosamine-6-phosphate isomerase/deaminase
MTDAALTGNRIGSGATNGSGPRDHPDSDYRMARDALLSRAPFPATTSSRNVAFLVTGRGKRDVVVRAQAGDWAISAALVRPVGRLYWFTDRAAAAEGAN